MRKLIDVTDRRTRLTQMGSIMAASALRGLGAGVAPPGEGTLWAGGVAVAAVTGILGGASALLGWLS